MTETQSLSLDFEPGTQPDAPSSARIFVETAASYLKESGAVVISSDCASTEAFRAEVERLMRELWILGEEANLLFGGGKEREIPIDSAEDLSVLEDPTITRPKPLLV